MTVKQIARLVALLMVIALAIWGLYLLIVGLPSTNVPRVPPGEPLPPGLILYMPYHGALYSLLALALVAIGLMRDRWLPLAWVGLLLHLIIGGLLIWGMGIFYIAATGGLALLVGVLQWQVTHQAKWLLAAWAGVVIVLVSGALLLGTVFGPPILVVGILLGLLLVGLDRLHSEPSPQ